MGLEILSVFLLMIPIYADPGKHFLTYGAGVGHYLG